MAPDASAPDGTGVRSSASNPDPTDGLPIEETALLAKIFQTTAAAIVVLDAAGHIVRANERAGTLLGMPAGDVEGRRFDDQAWKQTDLAGEAIATEDLPVAQIFETRAPVYDVRHAFEQPSGRRRILSVSGAPLLDDDDEMVGAVCLFHDITDEVTAQRALRSERDLLTQIFDTSAAAITVLDAEGNIIKANARAEEVLGLSPAGVESRTYDDPEWRHTTVDGEPFPDEAQPFVRVMNTEAPVYNIRHAIEWPDGERRILSINGAPLRDETGTVSGAVFVVEDVTATHHARRTLAERTVALNQAQALAGTGSGTIYPKEGAVVFSKEAAALFGTVPHRKISIDELLPKVHEHDRDFVRSEIERVARGESHDAEYRIRREANGDVVWIHGRGQPMQDREGDVTHVLFTIRDVTEARRRRMEQREREAKLRALTSVMRRLLRRTTAEGVAEEVLVLIQETMDLQISAVRLAKGNELVPVGVTARTVALTGGVQRPVYAIDGPSVVARAFREGEPALYEDVRTAEDSLDRGQVRAAAYVPIGGHGLITLGSVEVDGIDPFDVQILEILARNAEAVLDRIQTEQEIREARDEAQAASRLKSAVIANMSHEVRTPLTSISGFSEIIQTMAAGWDPDTDVSAADRKDVVQFAGLIRRGSRRLRNTLTSVLELSRLEAGGALAAPTTIHPAQEMADLVAEVAGSSPGNAPALELDTDAADPVRLPGGAGLFSRIVYNLVDNAIKFTPPEGRVAVRAATGPGGVWVEVDDTGIGMAPQFQDAMFDAFTQESEGRRREHEGSGLGLAIVQRLVALAGGTLEVESTPGLGTRMSVFLPEGQVARRS